MDSAPVIESEPRLESYARGHPWRLAAAYVALLVVVALVAGWPVGRGMFPTKSGATQFMSGAAVTLLFGTMGALPLCLLVKVAPFLWRWRAPLAALGVVAFACYRLAVAPAATAGALAGVGVLGAIIHGVGRHFRTQEAILRELRALRGSRRD